MYVIDGSVVWLTWPVFAGLVVFLEVRRRAGWWRTLGVLVLVTYAMWIVSAVFFPLRVGAMDAELYESWSWWGSSVNLVPFRSLAASFEHPDTYRLLRMHGGNFLLLAPFTLLGPILWARLHSWWKALLLGLGASVGIELGQWLLRAVTQPPFRSVDIDDVILNTAGALFGYGLYVLGRATVRRTSASRAASHPDSLVE